MPNAPTNQITCRTFGEAAGLAIELHELFAGHHAVLLLDGAGRSIDLFVFADAAHELTHAVCVASAFARSLPLVERAVLFSEVRDIDALAEDDARQWQVLQATFAHQGVELLDWIHTDDEKVRSLTISCDAEPTWLR